MINDLVSIIMPSYNTAKYIEESVNSVLAQTYTNWELLIVDDCSTDNTMEILSKFADNRIRIFRNEQNSGAAVTRNKALREAKGRWIAFLDSDDLWLPEKLEKQLLFMQKYDYAFTYTNYECIDETSHSLGTIVTGPKKVNWKMLHRCNWCGCLTVLYDAKKVGIVLSPNVRKRNDWTMWLQISEEYNSYLLDKVLAKYRKHKGGSVSTSGYSNLIAAHYHFYRFCCDEGILRAGCSTLINLVSIFIKKGLFEKRI